MKLRSISVAVALSLGSLAACSSQDSKDTQITVLAAASLKVPFTELAQQFETDNPGTTVRFNFAGSSDLVAQLQQGAPGDVLATADEATMKSAETDGLTTAPTIFTSNSMTVAVSADNPGDVTGLSSLAEPALNVVVCAPQVPCGAATTRIEEASGIDIDADSEESSVTDVLNKVATGEADAGIVYLSDVATQGGSVIAIDIPAEVNTTNKYSIAVLSEAADGQAAQQFVDLVTRPEGQQILAEAGFGQTD